MTMSALWSDSVRSRNPTLLSLDSKEPRIATDLASEKSAQYWGFSSDRKKLTRLTYGKQSG